MKKQNPQDELMLFNAPRHHLENYVHAHQLAGDLKLAPDAVEQKRKADHAEVLARLARRTTR